MKKTYNVLILGASYGSVIAIKVLAAGHNVDLLCLEQESKLINAEGINVSIPSIRNKEEVNLNSKKLSGKLNAITRSNLENIDICFLAMQEHQYIKDHKLTVLLKEIATKNIPMISVMNIPPSIFLKKIKNIQMNNMEKIYKSYEIWENINLNYFSASSPDPQAFKPNPSKSNFLKVRLASNFKIAKFNDDKSNYIIQKLETDIKKLKLPIYFNIFESSLISLAKWPMLITGNYRCIKKNKILSIKDAILENIEHSKKIYNSVLEFTLNLGANKKDLIIFEKYLKRSSLLDAPSSVARAINNNNKEIERFDLLLSEIAKQKNFEITGLNEIIETINIRIKQIN